MVLESTQKLCLNKQKTLQKDKRKRTETCWWKSWNTSVRWKLLKTKSHWSWTEWETWFSNWKSMAFKLHKKVNKNQSNPLKPHRVDLTRQRKKWMKSKRTSSTSLEMKQLKLRKNWTLLVSRFNNSKTSSRPTCHTPMTTTCQLRRLWIFIRESINIILSCKLFKNKLRKMLNLKIFLNWKEEITNHWKNVWVIWKVSKSYGILLLWSTCSTTIGKENFGDKSRPTTSLNRTKYSPTKSKPFPKKSDSSKAGKRSERKSPTWLLSWTWLKVWEEITCKIVIGNNSRTKLELSSITNPLLSHSMISSNLSFINLRLKLKKLSILHKRNQKSTRNLKSSNKTGPNKSSSSINTRKITSSVHLMTWWKS